MKIVSPAQIKEWDLHMTLHEHIASIDLVERACLAFTNWFVKQFSVSENILIVCGYGCNGADGLGIARLLHNCKYTVSVWIAEGNSQAPEFLLNRERLPKSIVVTTLTESTPIPDASTFTIVIDALLGMGLSYAPRGIFAKIITTLNNTPTIRVAVDIPSGLPADTNPIGVVLKAHHTITFQFPKLSFFLPQNYLYVGDWLVISIGSDRGFSSTLHTNYFFTQTADVCTLIRSRKKFDHKGTYGRALLIAGSYGKTGAAVLAAKAAMRSGVGLLTVHVPQSGYSIIQTTVPESMTHTDINPYHFSACPNLQEFDSIGIGPGLGLHQDTQTAFQAVLQKAENPLVIDADALNIIAQLPTLIENVPKNSILTPHPGEFKRLVGSWKDDFERLEKQKWFSVNYKVFIVLKGAHTSISTPEGDIHFNSTGNAGMSTAGSGDVLTGVLTGLIAQGYSPLNSALLGVFLHGLAGDLASKDIGKHSLIASDIIEKIPKAYLSLENIQTHKNSTTATE